MVPTVKGDNGSSCHYTLKSAPESSATYPRSKMMQKIEVILVKGKETKGTYVYEEELGEGGKPPVLKSQYIQKWVLGSNPPAKIKVTIEAV